MRFVIMDESTAATATPELGGPLTPALLQQISAALEVYADRDVAFWWGGQHTVRVGSVTDPPAAGDVVTAIVDSLPDSPTTVAYHTDTGAEIPVIFLSRQQCNSVLVGNGSVSDALSHEIAEVIGDPPCNRYSQQGEDGQGPNGLFATEIADPTQEDWYEIDGVSVSNFVLPSFFATGAAAPWTYLGNLDPSKETVTGPFQTAKGGYQITMTAGTNGTVNGKTVTGSFGRRWAKVRHWSSRLRRRGIVLP
jgi:hypothetical protein